MSKKHSKTGATKTKTAVVLQELTGADITPEERLQMIAEAAYYRAQQRGFDPSEQVRDWLEAEAYIDTVLQARNKQGTPVHH